MSVRSNRSHWSPSQPQTLQKKYGELKKNLTTVISNYEKSDQDDPDKTENDFADTETALLYCLLRLDQKGFLVDFGVKRLPVDTRAEDGSPPNDDDAPGADPAAAASKRRRSKPVPTAIYVLPASAATAGTSMDQELQIFGLRRPVRVAHVRPCAVLQLFCYKNLFLETAPCGFLGLPQTNKQEV